MTTILLIEDSLEIRENTAELLELAGCDVVTASNGQLGISIAKDRLPGLILCDISMPEADGYEVFKQLKDHISTSVIPFIFVTASVEKKEVQAGLDMGAAGYIQKPFDEDELLKTIDTCLNQKPAAK